MKPLSPDETVLEGGYAHRAIPTTPDDVTRRIRHLVSTHLVQVALSADGWAALYSDPSDGRLWELTYPDSDSHGGGAPRLECIDLPTARTRYQV